MNGEELVHFIRPFWLLALPLAALLPWLWRRARRPSGDWEKVCDVHLLKWLSREEVSEDHRTWGHWIAGFALAILVLALAGPSWQQLPDSSFSARDARVIVLDLSDSMLATDLRPDRLTRARFRLDDLLKEMQEGQTGLVAYAGDAYVVSPLTTDTNTIANLLPALRPDVMPVKGSRADRALDLAAMLLKRTGFSRGEVLLVTDSATAATAAKARELRDGGVTTSVLAVGTPEGAPIPSGGAFMTDRSGNVVIARLDVISLKEVASAGEGRYSELGPSAVTGETPWAMAEGSEFTRREEALDQRWKDSGPLLVLLLLPLALMGFRRGALFALPLCLATGLLHTPDASAGWWEDLWQRRDQQAWHALENAEHDRAAALAQAPDLSGEAWYRSGNYGNALGAWSKQQSADADYNRGNALAQMGEYDGALAAYDRALEQQPDMEDAKVNRELVEEMKRKQEQEQQEQEDGESGEGESQEGESQEQQGENQEGEPSEGESQEEAQDGEQQEGEQDSEQEGGEQGEPQDQPDYSESWSEEDAQAMEQWLRRIPDDPGGLLRRKFINEHQRRGAPEDEPEPL